MFENKSLLVSILCALVVVTMGQKSGKLQVLVLYETLCPDSIRFIKNQLGPSYQELQDHIDISLVPFGKSESVDHGAQFFCQHGPNECQGNRMQSCVLAQTIIQPSQVKFVVCQMSSPNRLNINACAESAGLSSDINACMNTQAGTLLQLEAEKITQKYAIKFVPTIVYDNVFDQQLQDDSLINFRAVVLGLLHKRGNITHDCPECA